RQIPRVDDPDVPDASTALEKRRLQAEEIKQAVRARYDVDVWRATARPLRDRLRARQRDALASWLVGHDSRFPDAQALYDQLLLDVQISPCQLTSRLKQAISSVQLFVQRALLNLEPKLELSADDAREWKWRKSYRVWEANRKVFLYPENWIEPELRDDKSPFFEELENELHQSEITDASAESAVRRYLEKLDDVARLEVVSFCREVLSEAAGEALDDHGERLHVFGRTRAIPHRYYYRRREPSGRWTPWESVEIDIEGNQLRPVIFNRRLYLFWTQISETAEEESPNVPVPGVETPTATPKRFYQLTLAMSEYRNGRFRGKRVAPETLGPSALGGFAKASELLKRAGSSPAEFFLSVHDEGDLLIKVVRYSGDDARRGRSSYVCLGQFRLSGCDGQMVLEPFADPPSSTVRLPVGCAPRNNAFVSSPDFRLLTLPVRNPGSGIVSLQPALGQAGEGFEIVPQAMTDFDCSEPFFYQDRRRSFFVEASDLFRWSRPSAPWAKLGAVSLDVLRLIRRTFQHPPLPSPDPWILDARAVVTQPPHVERQIAVTTETGASVGAAGLVPLVASRVGAAAGLNLSFVGAEPVVAEARRVGVRTSLRFEGTNLAEPLVVRSSEPPGTTPLTDLLSVTATYTIPVVPG
ncbi:MAG: hypothetical protein KC609_19765, partial [Myxococcales bacterium]|nr:hypothetical protein [Myxococcales bacterium]